MSITVYDRTLNWCITDCGGENFQVGITKPLSSFLNFFQCICWRKPCRNAKRMGGWNRSLVKDSVAPSNSVFPIIPGKQTSRP